MLEASGGQVCEWLYSFVLQPCGETVSGLLEESSLIIHTKNRGVLNSHCSRV